MGGDRRWEFARMLGEVLRNERERQGLSQRDCAMLLDMDPAKLCRWERGQAQLTALQILQWSRVMNCNAAELLEHAHDAMDN